MIVTPDFVLINFPKTGSTFSRAVIQQAYRNRDRRPHRRALYKARLATWPVREPMHFNPIRGYSDQHGRVEQIAEADRHKPVVSIARDPIERILSSYNHYLHLKAEDYLPAMNIVARRVARDYPNVTFPEYYEIWRIWNAYWHSSVGLPIGAPTIEFLNFFATDPDGLYRRLRAHPDDIEGLAPFFPANLTFLRNESLNADLKAFLLRVGFRESEVAFIEEAPKVYPDGIGRSRGEASAADLDPDVLDRLVEEQRVVYKVYERYGIRYAGSRKEAVPSGSR
jgi:hypothetical protein